MDKYLLLFFFRKLVVFLAYHFNYIERVDFQGVSPDFREGPDSCICICLGSVRAHADYPGVDYMVHLEALKEFIQHKLDIIGPLGFH